MTLNQRYKRNIRNHLSFYLCAGLLTMLAVLLYLLFSCGVDGQRIYVERFYRDCHLEDAQFTTDRALTDKDIANLEEKYGVTIEEQLYADYDVTEGEKEFVLRVTREQKKVNGYEVSNGRDLESSSEVLLTSHIADAHRLINGESRLEIGGKTYLVTGQFERPDYMFCLQNTDDTFAVAETFGLALVTDQSFDEIPEDKIRSYYAVRYGENTDEDAFRAALYDGFGTNYYLKAQSNSRINTLTASLDSIDVYSGVILPIMVLFVVLMTAIVLGRKIRQEQKMLGVLQALGYKKSRLALHYSFFGVIPGLTGGLPGLAVALALKDEIMKVIFYKTEPLPAVISLAPEKLVLAVVFPTAAYFLTVYFTAMRIMKGDVVGMIGGSSYRKDRSNIRMANSGLPFQTKFKIRQIFGNRGRSAVVVLGILIGGFVIVFCLACIDSMDAYVNKTVDTIGSFEYEYFLSGLKTDQAAEEEEPISDAEDAVKILSASFEVAIKDDTMLLMGMDDDKYINTMLTTGENGDLADGGYYISSMGAMNYDVEKGDQLTFIAPASRETYTVTIDGVVENDSQCVLYTSREKACVLLGLPEGCYNVLMSDRKLDIDEKELSNTITKQYLADQIEAVMESMEKMMGIIDLFGAVICIAAVFLMVNMLISENTPSLSMLKVLGYHDKEINRMVISVYHALIPVGIVLSLAAGVAACKKNFEMSVSQYSTYIETTIYPKSVIEFILIIVISYALSLVILSRKVKKTGMVESLKDNRE